MSKKAVVTLEAPLHRAHQEAVVDRLRRIEGQVAGGPPGPARAADTWSSTAVRRYLRSV